MLRLATTLLAFSVGGAAFAQPSVPAPSGESATSIPNTVQVNDNGRYHPDYSRANVPPDESPYVRPRYGSLLTNGSPYGSPGEIPNDNTGAQWQPGGAAGRIGSPYYYSTPGSNGPLYTVHQGGHSWSVDNSAYQYHFGPGYYRHTESGHYRFPYYTYRAPWYFPGHPIYTRFTNNPW